VAKPLAPQFETESRQDSMTMSHASRLVKKRATQRQLKERALHIETIKKKLQDFYSLPLNRTREYRIKFLEAELEKLHCTNDVPGRENSCVPL